jgi:hypothetical protein
MPHSDSRPRRTSWGVECTIYIAHGCLQANGSFRIQLERLYSHDGAWPEPGSGCYALKMCCGSTEILIENGISVRAEKVIDSFPIGSGLGRCLQLDELGVHLLQQLQPKVGFDSNG